MADMLSRPPGIIAAVPASSQRLDYVALAAAQRTCPSLPAAERSSLRLRLITFSGARVLCDITRADPRPLIPISHRRAVFAAFHELAHPGARASRRLMAARVVWKGMAKDITAWCRDCQACSRGKVTVQPKATVQPIPVPTQRFSHVHVDLVGPLPTSAEGLKYLFTMVDRSSRWLEAIPLAGMDAATCADAFIAAWVARFGVPGRLTSDRGTQFTSTLWGNICRQLGVAHSTTAAYHPQANGMVERSHRQLKDALKARLAGPAWPQHLPWVLLGLRSAPKEDGAVSSAELVYGAPLVLPAQLAADLETPQLLVKRVRTAPPPVRHAALVPPAVPPPALASAEMVYVRRGGSLPPLTPPYQGPYRVLERGAKVFKLQMGSRQENITVDRLKPHLGAAPAAPAETPPAWRLRSAAASYAAAVAGGGPCSAPESANQTRRNPQLLAPGKST